MRVAPRYAASVFSAAQALLLLSSYCRNPKPPNPMRRSPFPGAAIAALLLALLPVFAHAQCTLQCLPGTVEIPLDASCIHPLQPEELLAPATTCPPPFSLELLDAQGQPVPGNILTDLYIYTNLTATVTHNGVPVQSCVTTIRVVDKITCPPDIQVQAAPQGCSAEVTLQPLDISDACNQLVLVQIQASFGTGQGPHTVPVGQHIVTYTAYTAMNDSVKCRIQVGVTNQSPPVVSCQNLSPSLQPSGILNLPVAALIASQSDACGIVLRQVRRLSPSPGAYGPSATFNCDDVGIGVAVRVLVTNASGLQDSCEAMVFVQDKTAPTVDECAPDITVTCDEYNEDHSSYGTSSFTDNCNQVSNVASSQDLRDKCGVGQVIRTFTATDNSGNTGTCTQVIHVINSQPLTMDLITWPENYVLQGCVDPSAVHPDSLAAPFNRPVVDGSICAIIAIGYKDETLIVNNPGCFKVFRTWTVIDCCLHDPQSPNPVGIFTYTQMIVVEDNVPPVLNCPATFPVSVGPNCSVIFANLPDITADDCNPKVKITNNSPFSITKGANASGNYPLGVTPVTFFASDGCGNFSSCKVDVVVSDFAPPTPQCLHGLATNLGWCEGEIIVKVNADYFNQKSYDNCTPQGSLIFSFSSDTSDNMIVFTCDDRDTNYVELWVTDAAGNQDFCKTYILVQDNHKLCPGNKQITISGSAMSLSGKPVPGVVIDLDGSHAAQTITDGQGSFQFVDVPPGGTYQVGASLMSDPLAGVSTYDVLLIQKHLLGVKLFKQPVHYLAADANGSGNLSVSDMVLLRKWILTPQPEIAPHKAWLLFDAEKPLLPPNPLGQPLPEHIPLGLLDADRSNVQFLAVKVGDISGDAFSHATEEAAVRNARPPLSLWSPNQELQAGDRVEWVLHARDGEVLQALQMALAWDPDALEMEGLQVLSSGLQLDGSHVGTERMAQGQVRLSWSDPLGMEVAPGAPLLHIRFAARQSGRLSDWLRLDRQAMRAEAVRSSAGGEEEFLSDIQLDWRDAAPIEGFQLFQNKPNPFRDLTVIGFRLPEPAEVILSLFTIDGQMITEFRGKYPPGYHEMTVPGELLPPNGVVFYRLQGGGFSETKKMIRQ